MRVRRCDERCHNAKRDECRCWCGGRFHGGRGQGAREAFVAAFLDAEREDVERSIGYELGLEVNRVTS